MLIISTQLSSTLNGLTKGLKHINTADHPDRMSGGKTDKHGYCISLQRSKGTTPTTHITQYVQIFNL